MTVEQALKIKSFASDMAKYKNSSDMEKQILELMDRFDEGNMSINDLEQELLVVYTHVSKRNWFERLPLHWRYIYYMVGGILIGYLLHYVC
jgi:hypothetical protein